MLRCCDDCAGKTSDASESSLDLVLEEDFLRLLLRPDFLLRLLLRLAEDEVRPGGDALKREAAEMDSSSLALWLCSRGGSEGKAKGGGASVFWRRLVRWVLLVRGDGLGERVKSSSGHSSSLLAWIAATGGGVEDARLALLLDRRGREESRDFLRRLLLRDDLRPRDSSRATEDDDD